MTPEEAHALADPLLFVGPREAVAALLLQWKHGETRELRSRAWAALMALDPDTPVPSAALGQQPDALEQLVHVCLRYLYGLPNERREAAALISARCQQAITAWERVRGAA